LIGISTIVDLLTSHAEANRKSQENTKTTRLKSISMSATWPETKEPYALPQDWEKHRAQQTIILETAVQDNKVMQDFEL
jgi:hypothetical protein